MIDYFDWLGILGIVGELNKELTKIDFKKYANCEQITAEKWMKNENVAKI